MSKNTIYRANFVPATTFQGVSSTAEVTAVDNAGSAIRLKIAPGVTKDRNFRIKVGGRINFGAGTFKIDIYDGLFSASGVKIASSGSLTPAAGSFLVYADCTSDPTSDDIQGIVDGHIGNTKVTAAAIEAAATWDPDVEHNLSVSLDWGSSNAGNGVQVRSLEVELL